MVYSQEINGYFSWLISIACGTDRQGEALYRDHKLMFDILWDTEFVWSIRKDENRCDDGLRLREKYYDMFPCNENFWFDLPASCTTLEMLVALASRFEDIMTDFESDKTAEWFWMMMDNSGLSHAYDRQSIQRILDDILKRRIDPDGAGGLFPLKYPPKDQRRIEFWYQMNYFINENF